MQVCKKFVAKRRIAYENITAEKDRLIFKNKRFHKPETRLCHVHPATSEARIAQRGSLRHEGATAESGCTWHSPTFFGFF
jgi:hypothetical protein